LWNTKIFASEHQRLIQSTLKHVSPQLNPMFQLKFAIPLCLLLSIAHLACSEKKASDAITVKLIFPTRVRNELLGKYVYLFNSDKRTKIDSLLVKSDTVVFNLIADSAFVPCMVAITRIDSLKGFSNYLPLGFNYQGKKNIVYSLFYLDRGETVIKPFYLNDNTIESSFVGSRQNEPYFNQVFLHYPGNDTVQKRKIINRNIALIKTYPYSVYLLKQLFSYKHRFQIADLQHQLSFFNDTIRATPAFKSFADYFTTASSFDKYFPNDVKLENQRGEYQNIGDSNSSYHLLVFWASWCGPCRKEIPAINELYKKYHTEGLSITSISIDENKQQWQTALLQEKMPWQQLLITEATENLIKQHYDIKFVPKLYLFDQQKRLISKSDDTSNVLENVAALFPKSR
jgi:thiol-disulfide isomerase/thioredoxin